MVIKVDEEAFDTLASVESKLRPFQAMSKRHFSGIFRDPP